MNSSITSLTIQSHKYLLNGKDRERPGRNKVGTIAAAWLNMPIFLHCKLCVNFFSPQYNASVKSNKPNAKLLKG